MDKPGDEIPLLPRRRTIGRRTLAWCVVGALLLTALILGGLVWLIESSAVPVDKRLSALLDAVKIGLSVGAGLGGLFALYLGWRRQHAIEADHEHQERVAAMTEADALSRRITDLYTKAMELVGSDEAAVRLGGMYALERLAQDNPGQRQTVVNVLCAYLRMPYVMTDVSTINVDEQDNHRRAVEEQEVRITAQRIVTNHLTLDSDPAMPSPLFWGILDLDLTGASLIDFKLDDGCVRSARFGGAKFKGEAAFGCAIFEDDADFSGVRFYGKAEFGGARFDLEADFSETKFNSETDFGGAKFELEAKFRRTMFERQVVFGGTIFNSEADFRATTFERYAGFGQAKFHSARFEGAEFESGIAFGGAKFRLTAAFGGAKFGGYAGFGEAKFGGTANFSESNFKNGVEFGGAKFGGPTDFAGVKFELPPNFAGAMFVNKLPDEVKEFWSPGTSQDDGKAT